MNFQDFFEQKLEFTIGNNLTLKEIDFYNNDNLTKSLSGSVYYYDNPKKTNTSFYLITNYLNTEDDFRELRRYIWNESDATLIFYPLEGKDNSLSLLYAKSAPNIDVKDICLDTFSTDIEDSEIITKIKFWNFESGVFWNNFKDFSKKIKDNSIDKDLADTLADLRSDLIKEIPDNYEIVQALIDRTLYIKYLEDNHIINSVFYDYYFKNKSLTYKEILKNKELYNSKKLNRLFRIIHKIFNNSLFQYPEIEDRYLTQGIRDIIVKSFMLEKGQLRLYDFQFEILPIEFISYVYEIFLTDEQKPSGIYYTPKKLAQLIVDDVINEDKLGSILDPSCGSGMFLVVGYQRLLEIAHKKKLEPKDILDKIKFRTRLLSENIFGIEKELTAQRFTLFSLSLQIFKGIEPEDIKNYIAHELKNHKKIDLFSGYSFFDNIKYANTLGEETPFGDKKFSYIIGNPPFFEIKCSDHPDETKFLSSFVDEDQTERIKDIVGNSQISQCFLIKIKYWANDDTRFGFVSNNSSFYGSCSDNFRHYFYSNYGIEKIYELYRVSEILFQNAKESVLAVVFNNNLEGNNIIDYYPVCSGFFSKKPFELLIIEDDKLLNIKQVDLVSRKVTLRDFLVGNNYDHALIKKLSSLDELSVYIKEKGDKGNLFICQGMILLSAGTLMKEFGISSEDWKHKSKKDKDRFKKEFYNRYIRKSKDSKNGYIFPLIKKANIENFKIKDIESYLGSNTSIFHRPRQPELFEGPRIICSVLGDNIKSIFTQEKLYFERSLYVLKLKQEELYPLIVAILNSKLCNYFINTRLRKRIGTNYPQVGIVELGQIPIPKDLDSYLVEQIVEISQGLIDGKYDYTLDKESELNKLIFDLYDLDYWEQQRIKDYFITKEDKKSLLTNPLFQEYKDTLSELLGFYFNHLIIENSSNNFNLNVVKVSFSQNSDTPTSDKVEKYFFDEISQEYDYNILSSKKIIYGKNCIYIIRENIYKNWTKTKAFEDSQNLLKHIMISK